MNLPKEFYENKIIPKGKFKKHREEFQNMIEKIVWKYTINEKNINIAQEKPNDEIIVIELILKEKLIPKEVIKEICKAIPYNLIFELNYDNHICYCFYEGNIKNSMWDQKIEFEFNGKTIKEIYDKLRIQILTEKPKSENFEIELERSNLIGTLLKEKEKLLKLKNKEKQINLKNEYQKQIDVIEERIKYNYE